ncbi:DUF1045 domain-containing protein [Algihabitans albus]|uniref:DUF1045 domain-containing protein n=1 Tax=Algihabitans albus TaxID=2164067 RepID=UPI000E5CD081|nr:DUF1045 domain-containing protein [Algihabitans albus]
MTERCALYFAPPPDSPLAAFAEAWFARDDNRSITESPRHYGFHATLKPPFRFAEGRSLADLKTHLRAFATEQPPVEVGPVVVGSLSGFLALVPAAAPPALEALAEACVSSFDGFRAPPSEAELAKRRGKPLSARQDELLQRWGYPHVFDQFRWHMTLTTKLPEAERNRWHAELQRLSAPALEEPLVIEALSLFHQPATDRPFTEIDRVPLIGTRASAHAAILS